MEKAKWKKGAVEWVTAQAVVNISVVFSWDAAQAYSRAVWWRSQGYMVRVGGPGVFVLRKQFAEVAQVGGDIPDVVRLHNPSATFASRGCPVGCSFCIVPAMEGRDFSLIPTFSPRPILCDNNLSGLPAYYQDYIIERYKIFGVPLLDAQSGFEPRTFDEEVFERWKPINRGPWRFALDDQGDLPHVIRTLEMLKDRVPNPARKRVYVLIGNEPYESCMERIQLVIDRGAEPHVQPIIKLNALKKEPWVRYDWSAQLLRDVARWANRWIWRATDFDGYQRSRRNRDYLHGQPGQSRLHYEGNSGPGPTQGGAEPDSAG